MDETTDRAEPQTDTTVEAPAPRPDRAIKMLSEDESGVTVGGYLVMWGDANRPDLQGEYFTKSTELWLDRYPKVPALYHHGLDESLGLEVLGHRTKAIPDDIGVWVEDWLDKSNRYWQMVEPLLKKEALYYSPGSVPHLTRKAHDGRLLTWPIVEDTLTVAPAQHRQRPVEQIKAAYKAANLEPPSIDEVPTGTGDGPSKDTEGSVCEDVPDGAEIERLRMEQLNRIALLEEQ